MMSDVASDMVSVTVHGLLKFSILVSVCGKYSSSPDERQARQACSVPVFIMIYSLENMALIVKAA